MKAHAFLEDLVVVAADRHDIVLSPARWKRGADAVGWACHHELCKSAALDHTFEDARREGPPKDVARADGGAAAAGAPDAPDANSAKADPPPRDPPQGT